MTGLTAEQREDGDLAAGFDTESEKPVIPTPKVEAQPKPAAPKPNQPEIVQLTREQFNTLETAAKKVTGLEAQVSKAFGTLGNVQETVRKLSTETRGTLTPEVLAEAYADMRRDFPELAGQSEAALKKIFERTQLTAGASATVDPAEVKKLIKEQAVAQQVQDLDDAHPDWRTIVGAVDGYDKHDPKNPFRAWLAKKDAAYRTKIDETDSAAVISRAISLFQKETAKPIPQITPRLSRRSARIRSAVQPRGDGGVPSVSKTPDSEFAEGFAEG